jgi:alkanesulfonate monooxygenase SsuD/methylene tetrahydromethanopterin reductase-like flavin-dependent oxidoreductase (luciferase family)
MFAMMTVIVAPTDEEAQAKLADYRRYADPEGALTLMSGWTGVDFSCFDPDQIVEYVESEAGRTALENITRADPDRRWTVREVAEHVSIGGIGPVIVSVSIGRLAPNYRHRFLLGPQKRYLFSVA